MSVPHTEYITLTTTLVKEVRVVAWMSSCPGTLRHATVSHGMPWFDLGTPRERLGFTDGIGRDTVKCRGLFVGPRGNDWDLPTALVGIP